MIFQLLRLLHFLQIDFEGLVEMDLVIPSVPISALEATLRRINPILKALQEFPYEVKWKPKGNSMTPRIKSGSPVRLKRVDISVYKVGDAVYAKVHGSYYLHLISAIDETKGRYQISNNHGHVNGWTDGIHLYGLCVEVDGKIIVSDEEIEKRQKKKLDVQ